MHLAFIGSGDAFGSGGRFHTCHALDDADGLNVLVDLGASAFHALKASGRALNAITTILITHYHGDHFGGLPYFFLDAQFVSGRTEPLTIVGPPGLERAWRQLMQACYPGSADVVRAFPVAFREIAPDETIAIAGATVTARAVAHDPQAGICLGYRVATPARIYAYSGDTAWTDSLIALAQEADLFVCECYMRSRKMAIHMDYDTLVSHLPALGARRVVLTHMSLDMLDHLDEIALETAFDGLAISI